MRVEKIYSEINSHGHMVWVDACAQMLMSGKILLKMAKELEANEDLLWIREEIDNLSFVINDKLWNDEDGFYYDLWKGSRQSRIKTIGAYWNLLADIVPKDRLDKFVSHLEDENEFNRPHRVPTTPANDKSYDENGGYWKGSVWSPTNYMVLSGLRKNGYEKLAFEIAENHVANVTEVFEKTGTVWENYSPEAKLPGKPAKSDFVGWTGLSPISILFEYVFGIAPNSQKRQIIWNINLKEKFGVNKYPFLNGFADLKFCGFDEKNKPIINAKSNVEFDLIIRCNGNEYKYEW